MEFTTAKYICEELADALERGDMDALQRSQTKAMMALVECQRKTAERVKNMLAREEERTHRMKGAHIALKLAYNLGVLVGGGALFKVLQVFFQQ